MECLYCELMASCLFSKLLYYTLNRADDYDYYVHYDAYKCLSHWRFLIDGVWNVNRRRRRRRRKYIKHAYKTILSSF